MEQVFDARGIPAADGIDARGIPTDGGIDARGIDAEPGAPSCPECDTPLRATGPGRRPVYCGRACSSKAYRRRRSEGQQDAVADALVSSRVDIPAAVDAGDRELMELAAAVQRAAARYLQQLDEARQGGEDPGAGRALELLETSVTGTTQRLLRKAHVLRYEMVAARGRAEREAAAADAAPAGPRPAAAPTDTPPVAPAESSRVETTTPPAAMAESSRVETTTPGADVVPSAQPVVPLRTEASNAVRPGVLGRERVVPEPAAALPRPRADVSSRVETAGPALGTAQTLHPLAPPVRSAPAALHSATSTDPQQSAAPAAPGPQHSAAPTALHSAAPAAVEPVQQPAPADPTPDPETAEQAPVVPEQLRLVLDAQRTSVSPLARGLGAPSDSWKLPDSDLVVEGWAADPDLFAVRNPDRRLVGWVAKSGDGWGSYIDGSLVIDAVDGDPWLARDAQHAVSLLLAALDQQRA